MRRLLDKFKMPHDKNLDKLLVPISERAVPAFWISKFPVTNALYAEFLRTKGDTPKTSPNADQQPVVGITWNGAAAFAAWLGGDLPTVEQWEKAARGHGELRHYPWGDEFDSEKCACAEGSSLGHAVAVGSYPAGDSPYGVSDMVGNVMEWLKTKKDPQFAGAKGGAFDMTCEIYGLVHFTTWVELNYTDDNHGFRVVSMIDPRRLPGQLAHRVVD